MKFKFRLQMAKLSDTELSVATGVVGVVCLLFFPPEKTDFVNENC